MTEIARLTGLGRESLYTVVLEQLVQLMHVARPQARAAVGQLGQVLERRLPQGEQVLALQMALGAPPRDSSEELCAVLGEHRAGARFELPGMDHLEAPGETHVLRYHMYYRNS